MNLNKAMIIGNLTRDPEVRTIPSGQNVASFGVATNMVWTDQSGQRQEKVEFHNIVAWRKLADICGQYLRKGSKVYLEGRLQTHDYLGQDGVKRYKTEIVAENMIMLDRPAGNQTGAPVSNYNRPAPRAQEPVINVSDDYGMSAMNNEPMEEEIKVENIPF